MPHLQGSRVKLERARRHIAELRAAYVEYLKSKPLLVHPTEAENGDQVWIAKFQQPIPVEWAAILGDAIHNTRSALDLMVWQLVELNGQKPGKSTFFPIGLRPSPDFSATMLASLKGCSPHIVRLVQKLRPYKGGNGKLCLLHELDIIDKHRLILVAGAVCKQLLLKTTMSVPWSKEPITFPTIAVRAASNQPFVREGQEVFRVQAAARGSEVQTEYGFVFELALNEPPELVDQSAGKVLEDLHSYVSRIVAIGERLGEA
jgi:hypothetical protein